MSDSATPPIGDLKQAEKYIDQLIELLKWDKATLSRTKIDSTNNPNLRDHYRINLGDHDAEISHSLHPTSGQNLYIIVFTNVAQIRAGQANTAILSYIYLNEPHYQKFKSAAESHFERKRLEAEQERFKESMQPVDHYINTSLYSAKTH